MSPTDGGKIGTLPARPHRLPPAQRFLSGSWRGTSHDFTNPQGIYSLLPPSSTAHTLLKLPPPRPDPQCIPQKLCIVNYSGRPLHPVTSFHVQDHPLGKTCNSPPRLSALQLHGRARIVTQRHGCSVLGKRPYGLLRVLKNRLVETSSESFRR